MTPAEIDNTKLAEEAESKAIKAADMTEGRDPSIGLALATLSDAQGRAMSDRAAMIETELKWAVRTLYHWGITSPERDFELRRLTGQADATDSETSVRMSALRTRERVLELEWALGQVLELDHEWSVSHEFAWEVLNP